MLIYNPQTSFPNNEPTDVGLGIKPKSTKWRIPTGYNTYVDEDDGGNEDT